MARDTMSHIGQDHTALLESELQRALAELEGGAPLLARMARYHLGWVDPTGQPTDLQVRQSVQGKRIRPQLAFRACEAVGGTAAVVAPLAAAIELLHNFTLIHDDIQDRSPNRRHRPTVWRIWGDAQAINAGDALFATAQRTLLHSDARAVPPETLLRLLDEFNRVTVDIVRGQVLDLEFEQEFAVSPEAYLEMIGGKTAAILRYAAWAGALVGGAPEEAAAQLGAFGEALGIGFQIRDDILGIWGSDAVTGKDREDDIRRRKKSLPILMLFDAASFQERERLAALYRQEEIGPNGIGEVLAMLETHDIRESATSQVAIYHERAAAALQSALVSYPACASDQLVHLIRQLDTRVS